MAALPLVQHTYRGIGGSSAMENTMRQDTYVLSVFSF